MFSHLDQAVFFMPLSISLWACGSCTKDNCQVSFSISDACTVSGRHRALRE